MSTQHPVMQYWSAGQLRPVVPPHRPEPTPQPELAASPQSGALPSRPTQVSQGPQEL